LADKGKILTCGPGGVNIEILIEGKWYPGYLEDAWYVPDIGRRLFWVRSAAKHEISVIIKRQRVMFQRDGQLVETGGWMTDAYAMDMGVVVPTEPAEVKIATSSETLQPGHERLGHQDERHVRKVLERMEINMSMAETGGFCDGCSG
jgi:hypothetical protein